MHEIFLGRSNSSFPYLFQSSKFPLCLFTLLHNNIIYILFLRTLYISTSLASHIYTNRINDVNSLGKATLCTNWAAICSLIWKRWIFEFNWFAKIMEATRIILKTHEWRKHSTISHTTGNIECKPWPDICECQFEEYIYIYVDQKTVALCLLSDLTCNYEKEVVRSSFIEAQMARPMGMRRCSANDTGVVKIFSYVYISDFIIRGRGINCVWFRNFASFFFIQNIHFLSKRYNK